MEEGREGTCLTRTSVEHETLQLTVFGYFYTLARPEKQTREKGIDSLLFAR